VLLRSDEEISAYGIANAYHWERHRQKANREKIELCAKIKKRIKKLSKKNRVENASKLVDLHTTSPSIASLIKEQFWSVYKT